jgi:heterodisulfide reductase subunit C
MSDSDNPGVLDLGAESDPGFAAEVERRVGAGLRHCMTCMTCSGGCPFLAHMDYGPHGVMRRVVYGLKDDVLASNTIWLCVGCHTCVAVCPMAIDITLTMDVLRQMSLAEGRTPAEPDVVGFHREVIHSIQRHGRTHKLEIMLRYKLQSRAWLQDMDLGLKMLAKRKLDLMPSRIDHVDRFRRRLGKETGRDE